MDALSDNSIETVVVMSSAQVGKTEIINNTLGYYIDEDPCPVLVVQPTLEMGQAWSKDRLAPMIRDTPALASKIEDNRTRDSGNTLLHKRFPGGHVTIAGANSPSGLASRPIRVALLDEVDRYPPSAGAEGDPVSLAIKRTRTFWNRKIIVTSTPTIKGFSRVDALWLQSDQRRYVVPCPHCDHKQRLQWSGVRWPDGKPEEAQYHCEECGAAWSESQRLYAISGGEWIATAPSSKIAGFHINELYSPWSTPADMAVGFIAAKGNVETRKVWVNTALGEPFEDQSEKVDYHELLDRVEEWGELAPNPVLVVTSGVDVQVDRVEVETVGWGLEDESWSLDYRVIYGDPSTPDLWKALDEYLVTNIARQDGVLLPRHAVCIDSGGLHTQQVYRFCNERMARRIYAIKGSGTAGRPVWPHKPTQTNDNYRMFMVGVNAAKDSLYARLKISQPGPGYCHFPAGRDVTYFEQLTAEQVRTKYLKGFPTREWFLPDGKRNEALDCRVYAWTALQSLNVRWGQMMALQQAGRIGTKAGTKKDAQPKRRVSRSQWMGN